MTTHRKEIPVLARALAALGVALSGGALGCGSQATDTTGATTQPASPAASATTAQAAASTAAASGTQISSATTANQSAANSGSAGTAASNPSAPAATQPTAAATQNAALPCDVTAVLARNCQSCHASTPIGGAPMSLMSYADLQAPARTAPALTVKELSKQRLNDSARPMPPGGSMSPTDKATLNAWLEAGAKTAAPGETKCANVDPTTITPAFSMDPLVAREGETCYEFKTHGSTSSVDNTPYEVPMGEHYANFYFKAPWPNDSVATRFGAKYDNLQVLHHWLLFSTSEDQQEGYHETSPLPSLLGRDATLLSGWAVGGSNLEMPADVGGELPVKGTQVNIQWHFYNATDKPQMDMTAIQVCTVPASQRKHKASVSWIGTEDINGNVWTAGAGMPPHQESTFEGTCDPLREGMSADEPIHIIGFWPHMHQLGTLMETFIEHTDGSQEKIFSKPFDFNHQIHYLQDYELKPGEKVRAVCHYNNTTDRGVPFGESSDTEMCYQFTFSWPAHALENHIPSLIGATNTCW